MENKRGILPKNTETLAIKYLNLLDLLDYKYP